MAYKLISFDLDGTLLDDYKKIPPENLEALSLAGEKGIYIVPASGRLYSYIPEEIRALPSSRFCITVNGSGVYDSVEKKNIYTAEMDMEDALGLCRYLDTLDVIYDCYADGMAYAEADMLARADDYFLGPVMNNMLHMYVLKSRLPVESTKGFIEKRGGTLQKMQIFFRDDELRQRQLKLLSELFPSLVFSTSLPNNIEINSARATKGQALNALCEHLNIRADEVIAFGDGLNDLDMMKYAGGSVAMINGDPAVKAAAARVSTTDNNHAGVAATLRDMGII